MKRLVFIDDDQQELDDLRTIVEGEYEYVPIRWPVRRTLEDVIGDRPSLIVLDLYFPAGNADDTIPEASWRTQERSAQDIAHRFQRLYEQPKDGKSLLRETFACISSAYDLLWAQCRELRQSPFNGRALLQKIQGIPEYSGVPIVFYSRKATVDEAVRALQAGATSVIRKPVSPPDREARESILGQLHRAESISRSGFRGWLARRLGFNMNVTLFNFETTQEKAEITGVRIG
jgi:CheY-like chemotaxis protein